MKTLLTLFVFIGICASASYAKDNLSLGNEVKAYDQIFEKIAEKRTGVSANSIDKTTNPFVTLQGDSTSDSNGTSQQTSYVLEATFDQKAKINGKWFQKNDSLDTYKLTLVSHNRVVLENEIEKKELYIRTKNDSNFKISYK